LGSYHYEKNEKMTFKEGEIVFGGERIFYLSSVGVHSI
jgi:hypothetical protein